MEVLQKSLTKILNSFLASRLSDRQAHHLVSQLQRFLTLKYGSLLKAALGPSQELNHVIGKIIYESLFGQAMRPNLARDLENFTGEAFKLILPEDIQFQVEDALNQFESSDFQVMKCFIENIALTMINKRMHFFQIYRGNFR